MAVTLDDSGSGTVFGRRAAFSSLELEHQPTEEPVQLLLLGVRERGGDQALDLGIQHRQDVTDRVEETIDVIAFLGLRGHVCILDVKLLDVKLSNRYSLEVK